MWCGLLGQLDSPSNNSSICQYSMMARARMGQRPPALRWSLPSLTEFTIYYQVLWKWKPNQSSSKQTVLSPITRSWFWSTLFNWSWIWQTDKNSHRAQRIWKPIRYNVVSDICFDLVKQQSLIIMHYLIICCSNPIKSEHDNFQTIPVHIQNVIETFPAPEN